MHSNGRGNIIESTLRLLLNERRRLLLQDAGLAENLLDGELYRSLRNLKQKVNYRDKVIEKKDILLSEKNKRIKELEVEVVSLKHIAGKLSRPITTSNNSSLPSSKNPIGIKQTKSLREVSEKVLQNIERIFLPS